MQHTRGSRGRVALLAVSAWLLFAATASALEWDQARVTELAKALHDGIAELRIDPGVSASQATAMQQRRHAGALAALKESERALVQLHDMLRRGRDRTSTQGVFERVVEIIGSVRALAEDSWIEPAAREKAARAREIVAELQEFYAEP